MKYKCGEYKIEFVSYMYSNIKSNISLGSHGLIEFSLAYDESSQDLLVNVIKAKVSQLYGTHS